MEHNHISNTRGAVPFKRMGAGHAPAHITKEQHRALIGKGNQYLQQGDIEQAEKIFCTLQYYDGINRVAQSYVAEGKIVDAFLLFRSIGADNERQILAQKIAKGIQQWLKEDAT